MQTRPRQHLAPVRSMRPQLCSACRAAPSRCNVRTGGTASTAYGSCEHAHRPEVPAACRPSPFAREETLKHLFRFDCSSIPASVRGKNVLPMCRPDPMCRPVLSPSMKLKGSFGTLESQVPQGSIYPIQVGTRFHIPDFSLISDSPGDKASTPETPPCLRDAREHCRRFVRRGSLRERERERERESFIRNNLHNGVVSGAARGQALLGPMWAAVTVACRA